MTDPQIAPPGRWTQWREHRRAKRQDALERRYFEHERSRSTGISPASPSTDLMNASTRSGAYGTIWMTFLGSLGGSDGGGMA